jgi:hypothetical protein
LEFWTERKMYVDTVLGTKGVDKLPFLMNVSRDEDDEFLYGTSKDNEPSASSIKPSFNGPSMITKSDDYAVDEYAVDEGSEAHGGALGDDSEEEEVMCFHSRSPFPSHFVIPFVRTSSSFWSPRQGRWISGKSIIYFSFEWIRQHRPKRQNVSRPTPHRTSSGGKSAANQPSLTTEYTPRERGTIAPSKPPPPHPIQTTTPAVATTSTQGGGSALTGVGFSESTTENGAAPDPSTLQPVTAPPSHPSINPSAPGVLDGRSIFDIDIGALAEKPWRRPGSDISDWFNYGFDEISWEAYCYRRRELGEMASVLKANVLVSVYGCFTKNRTYV